MRLWAWISGRLRGFLFFFFSDYAISGLEGGIRNKAADASPFQASSLVYEFALFVGEIDKGGLS
jgi:hypothetical protein